MYELACGRGLDLLIIRPDNYLLRRSHSLIQTPHQAPLIAPLGSTWRLLKLSSPLPQDTPCAVHTAGARCPALDIEHSALRTPTPRPAHPARVLHCAWPRPAPRTLRAEEPPKRAFGALDVPLQCIKAPLSGLCIQQSGAGRLLCVRSGHYSGARHRGPLSLLVAPMLSKIPLPRSLGLATSPHPRFFAPWPPRRSHTRVASPSSYPLIGDVVSLTMKSEAR